MKTGIAAANEGPTTEVAEDLARVSSTRLPPIDSAEGPAPRTQGSEQVPCDQGRPDHRGHSGNSAVTVDDADRIVDQCGRSDGKDGKQREFV